MTKLTISNSCYTILDVKNSIYFNCNNIILPSKQVLQILTTITTKKKIPRLKFFSAKGMRNILNAVAKTMSVIVCGINAPLVFRSVVGYKSHSVSNRIQFSLF